MPTHDQVGSSPSHCVRSERFCALETRGPKCDDATTSDIERLTAGVIAPLLALAAGVAPAGANPGWQVATVTDATGATGTVPTAMSCPAAGQCVGLAYENLSGAAAVPGTAGPVPVATGRNAVVALL